MRVRAGRCLGPRSHQCKRFCGGAASWHLTCLTLFFLSDPNVCCGYAGATKKWSWMHEHQHDNKSNISHLGDSVFVYICCPPPPRDASKAPLRARNTQAMHIVPTNNHTNMETALRSLSHCERFAIDRLLHDSERSPQSPLFHPGLLRFQEGASCQDCHDDHLRQRQLQPLQVER